MLNELVHKPFSRTLLAFIVLALASCSSAVTPRNSELVDADTSVEVLDANASIEQLESLLAVYQSLDDLNGQWQIHYRLAARQVEKAPELAQQHAQACLQIGDYQQQQQRQYRCQLLLARLTNDQAAITQIANSEPASLAKALALSYSGQTQQALTLVNSIEESAPADKAFIWYQHGKAQQDISSLMQALSYYRVAGQTRGVVDSLFSAALIAKAAQQPRLALQYANRALTSAKVLEQRQPTEANKRRLVVIEQWLQEPN